MRILLKFYQSINLLNAILSFVIGLGVLFSKKLSKQIIQFSLFAFFVSLWALFYFLAFQSKDYYISAIYFRTCMIAGALILPMFTEFVFTFVGKKINPIYRWLNWGLSALIISTIYTNYYAFDGGPILVFHYWPVIGVMSFIQIILYGINVFFSHRELFKASKSSVHFLRQQAKIILFGTSLGYFGAATNFLLWFKIPFPPIFNIFIPIYVVSVAFAITKHELMDIRVAITKSVSYGMVGVLMILSFVIVNIYQLSVILSIAANSLLGLFWAFLARRAREFIQTPIEEKWIVGWYDTDKLIIEIIKLLIPVYESKEAFKILADKLIATIRIKNIHIFYAQKDKENKSVKFALSDNSCEFSANNPLVAGLKGVTKYDDLSDETKDSTKDCKCLKNSLLIPLFSTEGLEGVLVLGPKISEDAYDEKDFILFRILMDQALMVLDRIRPYENIQKEFEANQNKLYKAEMQIEKTQRLASLGTVAAGVAHEIRNPLGILQLSIAELNPQNISNPEFIKKFKDESTQNIKRINGIIHSMLSLSKGATSEKIAINLNEIIDQTIAFFVFKKVRLAKDYSGAPKIMGNPEELKQVFINLIDNAVRAMPNGGELKIKTYIDGGESVIEVFDTGSGINKNDLPKIFDPFFSTRQDGVGLGLSIVYRIVNDHNGKIIAKSESGAGSQFTIKFPAII